MSARHLFRKASSQWLVELRGALCGSTESGLLSSLNFPGAVGPASAVQTSVDPPIFWRSFERGFADRSQGREKKPVTSRSRSLNRDRKPLVPSFRHQRSQQDSQAGFTEATTPAVSDRQQVNYVRSLISEWAKLGFVTAYKGLLIAHSAKKTL